MEKEAMMASLRKVRDGLTGEGRKKACWVAIKSGEVVHGQEAYDAQVASFVRHDDDDSQLERVLDALTR